MAVLRVTTINRWIGESTDDKPDETTNLIPSGSTFYELDTGLGFIWNGSNWVEDLSMIYAMVTALAE